MEVEVIKKILENHEKWLRGEGGERANFRGANLERANLSYTNLARANLINANLRNANLRNANLSFADLENADLENTDLAHANLVCACVSGANLKNANLSLANFENACLSGAELKDVYSKDINFKNTTLEGAKNIPYIPLACPSEGAFIGWKKAHTKIIKLLIPEDSKRLSATSKKCRCNKAYVMEIQNINGEKLEFTEISSNFDLSFVYRVGEFVEVEDFCENRWKECSAGIHFFVNRQDAVNYF